MFGTKFSSSTSCDKRSRAETNNSAAAAVFVCVAIVIIIIIMGWSCSACTFLNSVGHALQCEMCGTSRCHPLVATTSNSTSGDGNANNTSKKRKVIGRTNTTTTTTTKKKRQTTLFGTVVANEKAKRTNKKSTTNTGWGRRGGGEGISTSAATLSATTFTNTTTNNMPCSSQNLGSKLTTTKTITKTTKTTTTTLMTLFATLPKTVPYAELKKRANEIQTKVFGISQLRLLQPQAIECALRRQSQLIILATGGGKSLCFQLPALVLGGTTLVISPLKALIADQVQALQDKGIAAAFLSSQLTEGNKLDLLERRDDHCDLRPTRIIIIIQRKRTLQQNNNNHHPSRYCIAHQNKSRRNDFVLSCMNCINKND